MALCIIRGLSFFITTRLAAATAFATTAATTYTATTATTATSAATANSAAATSANARYVCFLVDKQSYKIDIMCRSFLSF